MDEIIKKLTEAIEATRSDGNVTIALDWLLMDIKNFILLPETGTIRTVSDSLASYQDAWIRWKAQAKD